MYRRTKWVADNLRAQGAADRIVQIQQAAISLYDDYASHFHRPPLENFLLGIISFPHFAIVLRAQLVQVEKQASSSRGSRHF